MNIKHITTKITPIIILRILLLWSIAFIIFVAPKLPVSHQAALVFLTFGVGDLASTKYFLARGIKEGNPIMRYIFDHWGFSSAIILKTAYILIFLIYAPVNVWGLLAILGIMVTLHNYNLTLETPSLTGLSI